MTTKTTPEDFERRILLAVAGGSPAIVTETLYALTQTSTPAYLPTEIHIITTSGRLGHEASHKALIEEQRLKQLCETYGIPMPEFNSDHIHRITNAQGEYLTDITTAADNEAAADFITTKVRYFTQKTNCSIHVSIAGGRKTMSYYMGYAMSVFGRIQDRMSHVLVDDNYAVTEFYYPTKTSQTMTSKAKKSFDAKDVKVMLGDLPFIRLRDGLTEDLLKKQDISYSNIIEIAQRQLKPSKVELRHIPQRKTKPWQLLCSGSEVTGLNNAELALYAWLLYRHKTALPRLHFSTVSKQKELATQFMKLYKVLFGETGGYSKIHSALVEKTDSETGKTTPQEGISGKYFSPKKTAINDYLKASGAERYKIQDETERTATTTCTYFFLPETLQANDIHLPEQLLRIME